MSSPTLLIRRVIVKGLLACDLPFVPGLNIVQAVPNQGDPRSTNSAGKTGLVELIQHGLGKKHDSLTKWHFKPIVDQIQTLWLEIEANGEVLTIERSLQAISATISVRRGPYKPGIEKNLCELVPVDDMSILLLRILGIPEVSVKKAKGELEPLSFRLLMRAFILHQEDSFGGILDKVIPEQRKTDVVGFLSGIVSLKRFSIESKLSKVQTEVQELEGYFKSVQKFLAESGVPSLMEAQEQVADAEKDLQLARNAQVDIQREIKQQQRDKSSTEEVGRIETLRSQLFGIEEEIAELERRFVGLVQEEKRLKELLASLETDRLKVQRMDISSTILNSVEFDICPRCLQNITLEMRERERYARCCLCNRPLTTTSDTPPRVLPRVGDIELQMEEATTVLNDVGREKETLQDSLAGLRAQEKELSYTLDIELQAYVSPSVDRLLAQIHRVSQGEADLEQARGLLGQAQALGDIEKRLKNLHAEKDILEETLREARRPNKERLEEFRQIYEQILKAVDFPNFRSCSVDSQKLMPNINGSSYSSLGAALKGLATVCYHLALLELARREDTFFPLMLVIDSPRVADLNEENEDKLLRYLARLQFDTEKEHEENDRSFNWQIILTTRRVIDELLPYVKMQISQSENRKLLRRSD